MDYSKLSKDELKNGYRFEIETDLFICNYCGKAFKTGQVYRIDENFYMPEYAVTKHIENEHGANVRQLLYSDTPYNTLTDNQKELLTCFYSGMSDKEIAKKLGISLSTVRHQKFTFREKAKQAKHYLAVFESVFNDKDEGKDNNKDNIVTIHNNGALSDERFIITEQEKARILETCFESLEPLILKNFPPKEKKKVVILDKIAERFEVGKDYTEKEVNQIIKPVFADYVTIRRYLIEYGFINRESDCSKYWRI